MTATQKQTAQAAVDAAIKAERERARLIADFSKRCPYAISTAEMQDAIRSGASPEVCAMAWCKGATLRGLANAGLIGGEVAAYFKSHAPAVKAQPKAKPTAAKPAAKKTSPRSLSGARTARCR